MSGYAVRIVEDSGDFIVTVRDLPEVVTSGDSYEEARELAADAIEVAIAARIEREEDVPPPAQAEAGEIEIGLPAHLAAKASVYAAWRASGIRKTELARRMGREESEVRRILNPRHGTKLDQLDAAAKALGGRLDISFEPADRSAA